MVLLLSFFKRDGSDGKQGNKPLNAPVFLPKIQEEGVIAQKGAIGPSGGSKTEKVPQRLTIITNANKPSESPHTFVPLSLADPIRPLREALEAGENPILMSLSGSISSERLEQHMALYHSFGGVFAAVGAGTQHNLKFTHENGVLWITKHEKSGPSPSGCTVVDLLETDFIISHAVLKKALSQFKSGNSLIELFYTLYSEGHSVISCPTVDLASPNKSPFEDYSKANWTFQARFNLLDVIDERTDAYQRKHGMGPITYCNTTASKIWWQTYGQQIKGPLKDPRSTLADWKLVMDELGFPLRISSGTLLGWHRQCEFITYTSDIDTTLPIWMYTPEIMTAAAKHGFRKTQSYGNSSLENGRGGFELTFQHISTKNFLDIFWVYTDKDAKEWTSLWVRKNVLDRVYFAPGILSDTKLADFQGLLVEVPKDPIEYLYSSYGEHWNVPKSQWVWHNSVSNQFKGPFPRWPQIAYNIQIHPLVAEHRAKKVQAIREAHIAKGTFKPEKLPEPIS